MLDGVSHVDDGVVVVIMTTHDFWGLGAIPHTKNMPVRLQHANHLLSAGTHLLLADIVFLEDEQQRRRRCRLAVARLGNLKCGRELL